MSAGRRAAGALAAWAALAAAERGAWGQDISPPSEDPRSADGGPVGPAGRDQLKTAAQLGGSLSQGNTKAMVLGAAVRASLRHADHQVTLSGVLNYSSARAVEEGAPEGAPEKRFIADDSVYGRLRYDAFFAERNALFLGMLGFRDPSSGFRSRLMPYAGYLRLLAVVPQRFGLWVEGGYRVAWEKLDLDRKARADGLPERRVVHGPSAFVGVQLSLSEVLDLDAGVEALTSVSRLRDVRVNSFVSLLTRLEDNLWFGLSSNSRTLAEPIGDRAPFDLSVQAVLLHQHTRRW